MLEGISIEKDIQQHKMPRVVVIGVGGGGSNAVKNMIEQNLEGCEFCVCNTDSQALYLSPSDNKFLLGKALTNGLGAGGNPEVGRKAAEENIQDIEDFVDGADMVFLSVGMGGGTGTGASPVIAEMIKSKGIVCVGVVSKPFSFENTYRMKVAEAGIEELQQYVDTLIVIPNENLISYVAPDATFTDALKTVDDVLLMGVRAVADLMIKPGQINLDFNDIRAVVQESGKAIIGIGEVSKSEYKEETAQVAAQRAISNSLLEYNNIGEARAVLVNVTASQDLTFIDMTTACNTIRQSVHPDANVIFGMSLNDSPEFNDIIRLSVLATGISNQAKATGETQIGQTVVASESDVEPSVDTNENVDTESDFGYLNDLESVDTDVSAVLQQGSFVDSSTPTETELPSEPPLDSVQRDTTDMDSTDQSYATPETSVGTETTAMHTDDTPIVTGDMKDFSLAVETVPETPQKSIYDTVDKNIDSLQSDGFDFEQNSIFNESKKEQNGGLLGKLFNRGKKDGTKSTPAEKPTQSPQTSTAELPDFLKNQHD